MDKFDHYQYHESAVGPIVNSTLSREIFSERISSGKSSKTEQPTFVDPALEVLGDLYLPPASFTDDAPRPNIQARRTTQILDRKEMERVMDVQKAKQDLIGWKVPANKIMLEGLNKLASSKEKSADAHVNSVLRDQILNQIKKNKP